MSATVTMDLSEYQTLQKQKETTEIENSKLREQIIEAKISSSDPHLLAFSRAALDIVRYAVASLPPESNIGWPFESLRVVAEEILRMPDAGPTHEELAFTFRTFAQECEEHERRRKLAREVKQAPLPSLADLTARESHEIVATPDQDP